MSQPSLSALYQHILENIDPEPHRDGLTKTPDRAAKALMEITSGYNENIDEVISNARYPAPGNQLVVVKNIEYHSLCEHHILPFFGHIHIGYIPNDHIIGLSKMPRIVDHYAKRLQVQERLTNQIAHAILKHTNAQGVAVISLASHMCMSMRGIRKQDATMQCSSYLGTMAHCEVKQAFLTQLSI